jgi:Domain of unknown function (DUF3291)
MTYELAQVNFARLLAPVDSALLADFVALLDPVNATAAAADGFVWRLQTEAGNATSVEAFRWDVGGSAGVIVNMSVWRDLEALKAFVATPLHRGAMTRRREWFERMREPYSACWWVPAGHRPTTSDAERAVQSLRTDGPTPQAFSLARPFPAP